MHTIEMDGLTKIFKGKRDSRVAALQGLSLKIAKSEIFGFLGPNGAGKSTTIKLLMGLIMPTCGSASLMGERVTKCASRKLVGYLPENPAFYDFLTGREYLNFVGRTFDMTGDFLNKEADRVLSLMELSDAANRPIRGYSKGMVQRLGLAQALLHDPDLYILDEPMSGLDPLGRVLVKEIIIGLRNRGKTVFFSTHIIDDVEKICDRVAIILKGELKSVTSVEQILSEGITGYQIRSCMPGSDTHNDYEVNREGVVELISQLRAKGEEILLVEPRRRHLEDFFLSIVKSNKYEDL